MSKKIFLCRRVGGGSRRPIYGFVPNKNKPLDIEGKYQSLYTLVDDLVYDELNQYRWVLNSGYALRYIRVGKNQIKITLANEVLRLYAMIRPARTTSDHINVLDPYNILNNQLSNLRWATSSQQIGNQKKRKIKYDLPKGVHKQGKKFEARISIVGKYKYLGVFDTLEEAAEVFKQAWIKYHSGEIFIP